MNNILSHDSMQMLWLIQYLLGLLPRNLMNWFGVWSWADM